KIAPALGDYYLARTGFKSQQTDQPEDPQRPNNLWEPVDEHKDHGAHGAFDDRAKESSWELWADMHRRALLIAGAGVLGLVGAGAILARKVL
ncbi:MAG TPA: hypothetical protein VKV37_04490, partial [Ktedonobacteraceae bacterium]|nr:hypothetical protein [Ktedonobacteraceae bacterium]